MKLDLTTIALLIVGGYLLYTINAQKTELDTIKKDMGSLVQMVVSNQQPMQEPEPEPVQLRPYSGAAGAAQQQQQRSISRPSPSATHNAQAINPDPEKLGPAPGFPSQDLTKLFG